MINVEIEAAKMLTIANQTKIFYQFFAKIKIDI